MSASVSARHALESGDSFLRYKRANEMFREVFALRILSAAHRFGRGPEVIGCPPEFDVRTD